MNVSDAIKEMFSCNSISQQYFCYDRNKELLKDCTFIAFSENYGKRLPSFLQKDGDSYATIHLGKHNRFYAFNQKIVSDMTKIRNCQYLVDVSVALDTQIVSYLAKVFVDYGRVENYSKYSEIIEYLLKPELNCNCFPYLIENSVKISKIENECIWDTIKSFLLFKNFNIEKYLSENVCEYHKTADEIETETGEIYEKVVSGKLERDFYNIICLQKYIHVILLRTAIIELSNSKIDQRKKMKELVDYMKSVSCMFLSRELEICYYFFRHDMRVQRFFKKIKKNSKDIIKHIVGMSWDLTHIRIVEQLYAYRPMSDVDFSICCGMTSDKGLKEIMQINPIQQMVIFKNGVIPFYSNRWLDDVPEIFAIFKEERLMKSVEMEKIINELEQELNSIMRKI